MAHVELVVNQPDIGLDPDSTRFQGIKERHPSPVVVVRMDRDGQDVAREVGRPGREAITSMAALAPVGDDLIES